LEQAAPIPGALIYRSHFEAWHISQVVEGKLRLPASSFAIDGN
jgi:hypothetical protein